MFQLVVFKYCIYLFYVSIRWSGQKWNVSVNERATSCSTYVDRQWLCWVFIGDIWCFSLFHLMTWNMDGFSSVGLIYWRFVIVCRNEWPFSDFSESCNSCICEYCGFRSYVVWSKSFTATLCPSFLPGFLYDCIFSVRKYLCVICMFCWRLNALLIQ